MVGDVRRRVVEHLVRAGLPGVVIEDVQLAASEALANAVHHAYRLEREPGPVTVELWITGSRVVHLVVSDEGLGMVPRTDSPGAGLGLSIIASLATSVDIRHGDAGRGTRLHLSFVPAGRRAKGALCVDPLSSDGCFG
jgi:anti-sigma regulatory factor (Ser/Thr protein kinase)